MQAIIRGDLIGDRVQIVIETCLFGMFCSAGIDLLPEQIVRELIECGEEVLGGGWLAGLGDQLVDAGCVVAAVEGCCLGELLGWGV